MSSIREWRKAKPESRRAAWTFLAGAAVCGTAGVVINAAAGNPHKLSKHAVLLYGGSALALWGLALVLLVVGISRFNRASRATDQKREQATVQRLTDEHIRRARELAGHLLDGDSQAVGQVWNVVLQPGERALLEGTLVYSRYYGSGSPATYTHVSTRHYGDVGVGRMALDHAIDGAGNRRRAEEAAFAAAARWRDRQQSKVVITDRRLLCQVAAKGWLSFDHSATTAIQPVPQTRSLVLEYPNTAPVCLSGPLVAEIMVIVVWALYGPEGLREHPALADLRSIAPFPEVAVVQSAEPSQPHAAVDEPSPVSVPADLLTLIARHELMVSEQVAELLGMNEREAVEQLESLVEEGVLTRVRFSSDTPPVYGFSKRGAKHLPPGSTPPLDLTGHSVAAALLGA